MMDLRLGRYQDVLRDVMCNAVIVDAPYSAKTHAGHNAGADTADHARRADYMKRTGKNIGQANNRRSKIDYQCFSEADVAEFCAFWSSRCTGWIVSITDDVLAPVWRDELKRQGRYVFAPIPYINAGSGCRYTGDGPSNWTCWIVVARPRTREAMQWRTLPGAYILPAGYNDRAGGLGHGGTLIAGGKTEWLMRALIRDYSRPGDLVCDPCAGGATTLLAAAQTGRRGVGCEMDPTTYAKAAKRLRDTPVAVDWLDVAPKGEQGGLW
jgi:hypothetical protein